MIQRTEYLYKLIGFKDKQLIKIITGIRCCGKSTLLQIYQNWLQNHGIKNKQIISINFENMDFEDLMDHEKLKEYLERSIPEQEMTYVFLDELCQVEHFPDVIDYLYNKKNVDIYITASSEHIFSEEFVTLISGRYAQIEMFPLSFKEYIKNTGSMIDREIKYTKYVKDSFFPYVIKQKNEQKKTEQAELCIYLEGIYHTILVKDIIEQKKITDTSMLKKVLRFVFQNIGTPLSAKKISDAMISGGKKTDAKTVEKYLKALTESYIIYQVKRYNIKEKQYLKTLEKYYAADIGMRFLLIGSRQADPEQVLENLIYLELRKRGFEVYVGKINSLEVDFVAQKSRGTIYFQAAVTVRDEKLLKKELKPLQSIHDHYPKMILTLDDDPEVQYEGIRCINARDWLLGLND